MAELENDVDVEDTNYDDVESNEDDTQDTQDTQDNDVEKYSKSELRIFKDLKIDPENASIDDFRKVTKILAKTQDKIMERKKWVNKKGETEDVITEKEFTLREEVADFLLENKDYKEYKTELLKYRKQGFTIKQAVALIEADDKTIENRKKTNSMKVTDWEGWNAKTKYTFSELESMSQNEYNKIMDLKEKGKISITK